MSNNSNTKETPQPIDNPDYQGLASRIAKWTCGNNRFDTDINGLSLHSWPHPTPPTSYTLAPSICLIGQGQKRLCLEDQDFIYDAHHYLVTSVGLPVVSQIIDANEQAPYLGLTLELDLKLIAQMMLDREMPVTKSPKKSIGVAVSALSPELKSAFLRLLDLLDSPEDISVLAPLIKQEITHRLLNSEQGPRLRQILALDTHSYHIAKAIDWLTTNLEKSFRVEDLATKSGLSVSAFHNHFRAMTAMSPLQFQKKLRLNEARRLMLTENRDAATAAYDVGYESPSQFNREYSRQFGAPPMRDIKNVLAGETV